MTPLSDQQLLDRITEQEERLQFDRFDNDTGIGLGMALMMAARDQAMPVAINVSRDGMTLFSAALDGAVPDNLEWITRKNRVVRRFHRSSLYMGAKCRLAETSLEAKYLLPDNTYAAHGGAFPVRLRGTGVIGTATVSGLPQVEDHELVVAVLETFLARS